MSDVSGMEDPNKLRVSIKLIGHQLIIKKIKYICLFVFHQNILAEALLIFLVNSVCICDSPTRLNLI